MNVNITEDLPLASNDIDMQLLDSAKSGDLELVKVSITFVVFIIWYCLLAVSGAAGGSLWTGGILLSCDVVIVLI